MFSTKSVKSLKNLFASYHEPLPLSKQQSQKLLDGLKVSFRKQLDREHGPSSDTPASSSKPADAEPYMRHSAANRHLKDILSNPLFSYNKDISTTLPTTLQPNLAAQKRDPMEVFDHAVARGMMTPKAAIGVMFAKRKQLEAVKGMDGLSTSKTALRVIQWLRSTGREKNLVFLDNLLFVRALMPFLVAEGMEEIAWQWLTRVISDPFNTLDHDKQLRRSSHLLAELVHTKCSPPYGNLDSAISTMIQAQQMFKTSPLLSELLVLSWRSVSWFSTVEAYSRTAPSEELFEAHLATADRLPQPFLLERAHLHLHHPTHPDHVPALAFFNNKEMLRRLADSFRAQKIKKPLNDKMNVKSWLAFLGHDTVNHLAQSGRTEEAQGITDALQAEIAGLFKNTPEPIG